LIFLLYPGGEKSAVIDLSQGDVAGARSRLQRVSLDEWERQQAHVRQRQDAQAKQSWEFQFAQRRGSFK